MLGDPRLDNMNDTRWVHEIESLNIAEEERIEEVSTIARMVRQSLINLFGLNILPLEDPETNKLVRMEEGEYVPLVVFTGKEELLKLVAERNQDLQNQEQVEQELELEESGEADPMTLEEMEDFMDDGDVVFDENWEKAAMWKAPETQKFLENNVLPLEKLAEMQKAMGLDFGIPSSDESEKESPEKEAPIDVEKSETPDKESLNLEQFKFTIDD